MADTNRPHPTFRTQGLATRELDGELLVYDLEAGKVHCLAPLGRQVAELCDGTRAAAQIARAIHGGVEPEGATTLVHGILSDFAERNLLEGDLPEPEGGEVRSRRSLLVAAAALGVSLPVVSSLVAPTAAAASSSCVDALQPCTVGGVPCCPPLICVNTEAGPTSFQCVTPPIAN